MFWTAIGDSPHIGRANMDGMNASHIVSSDIGWPNGLTIDYDGELTSLNAI
jgi:hypothetical protein